MVNSLCESLHNYIRYYVCVIYISACLSACMCVVWYICVCIYMHVCVHVVPAYQHSQTRSSHLNSSPKCALLPSTPAHWSQSLHTYDTLAHAGLPHNALHSPSIWVVSAWTHPSAAAVTGGPLTPALDPGPVCTHTPLHGTVVYTVVRPTCQE